MKMQNRLLMSRKIFKGIPQNKQTVPWLWKCWRSKQPNCPVGSHLAQMECKDTGKKTSDLSTQFLQTWLMILSQQESCQSGSPKAEQCLSCKTRQEEQRLPTIGQLHVCLLCGSFYPRFSEEIYSHLDSNCLLPKEQKGCRKKSRGTNDQLLIDKAIIRNWKKEGCLDRQWAG